MENLQIAAWLREAAGLLEEQGANPYSVAAYRRAADTVEELPQSLREIFDIRGRAGLQALPGVGSGIAAAIAEMLSSNAWSRLARLRRIVRTPPAMLRAR
ncbi:MAG: helix-hairpin-helix domain-containing protein [Pseudomonadota bacterium]